MIWFKLCLCFLLLGVGYLSAKEKSETNVLQTDSLQTPKKPVVLVIPTYDAVKGRGGSPMVEQCLEDVLENNETLNVEKFSFEKYHPLE